MTLILLAPAAFRTTVNSVFSSAAGAAAAAAAASCSYRSRRRRRNTQLFFEQLHELRRFEQRQALNLIRNCVNVRHDL